MVESARVLLCCCLIGPLLGLLAVCVGYPADLLVDPRTILAEMILNVVLIGLVCAPLAAWFLRRKPLGTAVLMLTAITGVGVVVTSLIISPTQLFLKIGVLAAVFLAAAGAISLLIPRVWLDGGLCYYCGYDLRGSIDSARCPECGTAFTAVAFDDCRTRITTVPRRTHPLARPALTLAAVAPFLFGAGRLIAFHADTRPIPFDRADWQSAPAPLRLRMARDLVEREMLIGLSESRVTDELGQPDIQFDVLWYHLGGEATLTAQVSSRNRFVSFRTQGIPADVTSEAFDSSAWQQATCEQRAQMALDLETTPPSVAAGITLDEVRSLLGDDGVPKRVFYYKLYEWHPRERGPHFADRVLHAVTVTFDDGVAADITLQDE